MVGKGARRHAGQQHVEPAVQQRDGGERPAARGQRLAQQPAQRRQQRHDHRIHHQAGSEIDDLVALAHLEAETDGAAGSAARCGERRPAAAAGGCPHQRRDDVGGAIQTGARQRRHQPRRLPPRIGIVGQMLQGAAAADTEVWARRRLASTVGHQHVHNPGDKAVAARPQRLDAHALAGEAQRNVESPARRLGDAVAAVAEAFDPHVERTVRHRLAAAAVTDAGGAAPAVLFHNRLLVYTRHTCAVSAA